MEDVKAAMSPQAFAREAALALLPWRKTATGRDGGELPLF